jgi:hypothetical protein
MSQQGGTPWVRILVLGCVGLIVLAVVAAAAIFFFVMGAMKRSDVYREAMAIVERSPSAIAALGEPMKAGRFVSGSINVSGGAGDANLSIPLSGPTGKGRVHAAATREAGQWMFTALHLAVDGGETIDLLAESGGGAGAAAGGVEAAPGASGGSGVVLSGPPGEVLAALQQLTGPPPTDIAIDPTMTLWVKREYAGWENPLHTEMSINGTTINVFTSDTFQAVAQYLHPGWNTFTLVTTPLEPASSGNALIFRIGPAEDDAQGTKVMSPVLWTFRNDTDWKLADGVYSHPAQQDPKQVTLTYHLYYAGLAHEGRALAAGDYVLQGAPEYAGWNTPLIGTAVVNGRALTSFLLEERQLVINDLLQQGRNEVQLIAMAVDGAISGNDIELSLGGPAEWNESQQRFLLNPMVELEASTGWSKDPQSGVLVHPQDPAQRVMVRAAPFFVQ